MLNQTMHNDNICKRQTGSKCLHLKLIVMASLCLPIHSIVKHHYSAPAMLILMPIQCKNASLLYNVSLLYHFFAHAILFHS